jgi:ABC-type transport system substrate-binding protein
MGLGIWLSAEAAAKRKPTNFSNEQMDSPLETAGTKPDWNKRVAYYLIAYQLPCDDAPVIILSYSGPECIIRKPSIMVFLPTFPRALRPIFYRSNDELVGCFF